MSLSIDNVAEICHEAKRVRRQQIGDYSTSKWCEASDAEKELAKVEVRTILKKNFEQVTDVEGLISTGIILNLESIMEGVNV